MKPRVLRTTALFGAGALAALSAAVLLGGSAASAEAGSTTATLTLTGVRDSNCDVSTGGTTVYVAPGGDITFKAELAGLSVKAPLLGYIDLSSSKVASFDDKLIVDGHKKHPVYVSSKKSYTLKNLSAGTHKIEWSANSVSLLGIGSIPLNADTILPSSLPVGGQLDWVGQIKVTDKTKCGISIEVPGGGVTVGPVHVSVPPVTNIPTVPVTLPNVPGLPGGGGSSSNPPSNGGGGSGGGGGGGGKPTSGSSVSGLPTSIPELVVPNTGSGGDSAYGGGGVVAAQADTGNGLNVVPGDLTSSSSSAASGGSGGSAAAAASRPVGLDSKTDDGGIGGAQLPVVLAIVAIIALSLVTATYARMYLLKRPSA